MSDENKLNVNFEWFPEFEKLLNTLFGRVSTTHPPIQKSVVHCNLLLAATWKNCGQFSKSQKVHGRQTLDVQEAATRSLRSGCSFLI